MRSPIALLAAALLCVPALAACGDDDEGGGDAKTLTVTAEQSGRTTRIEVPPTMEGGLVEVRFTNNTRTPQGAQLIRVQGDHTVDEVMKVIGSEGGPIPSWLTGGGGVGETEPGRTRTSTQALPAGKYYVIGSSEEGRPPSATFTVSGGDSEAELPETDATITAKDYTFETDGLKPGRNEITFRNDGKELHHIVALPLRPGATIQEARQFLQSDEEPEGEAPVLEEGGDDTTVIDGGEEQVTALNLKAGKYVFACFIQDRKGGPPHVAKGMAVEVDVK